MKGKRIGEYHITNQLLGQGSFSQVYLGYSDQSQKVAVKIIPRDNIEENQIQVFQREIKLLNQCKHENIIEMLDVKKTRTNFYIFLQYCHEGNLGEYIQRKKHLSEEQSMHIFAQLVKGMSTMNRCSIVHRDLKPANIMLKCNQIKIIDFGLATKYLKGQMLRSYSGTPFNMAPQILKGEEYNEKAEIYSAGTILYQMLFGQLPFEDSTHAGLLQKIQQASKSKNLLSHYTTDSPISPAVSQLLANMLQPNPQYRIDLEGVMLEVKKWQNSKINTRLNIYKRMSACAIPYIGIIGGLTQMLNFNVLKEKSVYDMDMRICGRLSRKLINKEQEWMKIADLIRV